MMSGQPEKDAASSGLESIPQAVPVPEQLISDHVDDAGPPDGGYGWIVVLSVFIVNCFVWGVSASYGVFLSYYLEADIYPGATALDYAFIGGLNFGVAMIMATPVTQIVRRFGTHVPMVIGLICQSAGFISASFTREIWQLFLSQGVLVGIGMGFLFIPSSQCTSQWFEKRRSLANGITSSGSGIGGILFSLATGAIIKNSSFRWALRFIGISTLVMHTIATLLIRNRNAYIKPTQRGFDYRLLRRPAVLLLLLWAFVSMLGYMTVLYSLSAYARSIGLSESKASSVTAILNAGTAVGRPVVGVLSDRFGRIKVASMTTAFTAVLILALWLPTDSFAPLAVFAIVSGATIGTFWMTISPLCVEVAGLKELPSMLALSYLTVILPTTFGEAIALAIRRHGPTRVYLYPQIFSGLAYLLAAFALTSLWLLQRSKQRKGSGCP